MARTSDRPWRRANLRRTRTSPDYPNHLSDVPCPLPHRAGARVDFFPAHAAFPKWPEGRNPHCHFRGLLRLHSRYGPSDRSVTQGDLCHGAPAQPVTRPSRPWSYQINRQLSGWNPLLIRAFGAHAHERTSRVRSNRERGHRQLRPQKEKPQLGAGASNFEWNATFTLTLHASPISTVSRIKRPYSVWRQSSAERPS